MGNRGNNSSNGGNMACRITSMQPCYPLLSNSTETDMPESPIPTSDQKLLSHNVPEVAEPASPLCFPAQPTSTPALLGSGSSCCRPVGTEAAAGDRTQQLSCYEMAATQGPDGACF